VFVASSWIQVTLQTGKCKAKSEVIPSELLYLRSSHCINPFLFSVRSFPDKVRGVTNEGGLFGERKGWHLPGFDTSNWETRDLTDGLPDSSAGVGFFVTTFNLSIPTGFDVPLSFNFEEEFGQPYRVYMFVNGWMMGKRVGNLG